MNKKSITPIDEKGRRHGDWVNYHHNGIIEHKGTYYQNKKIGLFETYYRNGDMVAKKYFNINNNIEGIVLSDKYIML